MLVKFFTIKIPWFGKYSGYECLTNYFPKELSVKEVSLYEGGYSWKFFGKFFKKILKLKNVRSVALVKTLKEYALFRKKQIFHFLYYEETTAGILKRLSKTKVNQTVSTLHIPPSQWAKANFQTLENLKYAILLYEKDLEYFKKSFPLCDFYFIRHGVDINFFSPGLEARDKNKLLFVGHYLRDFNLLFKIASEVFNKEPEISLHLVIPEAFREVQALIELKNKFPNRMYFYENLSDTSLRDLYRECGILLLPMQDSGANTAIVQGLATGIPIVTNDVGGIRSYGGGNIFPVFKKKEVNEMISYISELKNNDLAYAKLSQNIRDFAIRNLDWDIVAKLHLEVYKKMLLTNTK